MKQILLLSLTTIAGIYSSYLFYAFYLKWNFNSEGKYFDTVEGITYNDSAFVWGILAFIFFIPLALKIFLILSPKNSKKS